MWRRTIIVVIALYYGYKGKGCVSGRRSGKISVYWHNEFKVEFHFHFEAVILS
jgi:hypothetical protein